MRTITRRPSHAVTESRNRRGSASTGRPSSPRVREQLVSDAVIAGYIHDISVRHHPESVEAHRRRAGRSDTRR
jgi:hypothetical protein